MILPTLAAAAWALTLGQPHDLAPALVLEGPLHSWALQDGTLYDVRDDEGRPVGFVFVGESTVTLRPGSARQGKVLANRLVRFVDLPEDEARAVPRDGLRSAVDGAVVLGIDAWEAVAASTRPIREERGRGPVVRVEPDGTETVLVEHRRPLRRDTRLAETWLADRAGWWEAAGSEALMAADRWERDAGTGAPARWLASLHTDRDWGLVAGDLAQPRLVQPWLEIAHDPAGVLSDGPATAWAHGADGPKQVVSRAAWPAERRRVDGASVGLTAELEPEVGGQALRLYATVDLEVRAVGGDAAHVVLDLPHVEQQAWEDAPPLPHGFELVSVEDPAGRPLEVVGVGREEEGRGHVRTVAVRLPEPLEDGDSATLRLRVRERYRYAHIKTYGPETQPTLYSFGNSTGLQRLLPVVRGHGGGVLPVRAQVGVAAMGRKTHAAVSHDTVRRWEDEAGRRWLLAEADSRHFALAAGKWHHDMMAPPAPGLPTLGLHPLFRISDFDRVARGVWEMISLYQPLLPPFPHEHLEVVEAARTPGAADVEVAFALVSSIETQHLNEVATRLGGMRSALALHAAWWMPHRVEPDDRLLPAASAVVYGLAGMEAVHGERDVRDAWRSVRDALTDHTSGAADPASLPSLVWTLGPVLTEQAGGPEALYAAVDLMLRGEHPTSWDGLASALAEATGKDWEGFLLTWVHSGVRPRVRVEWAHDGERIVGRVTSDLPFGSFGLPVRLGRGDDAETFLVPIVDGGRRFTIDWPEADRLVVDPDEVLPLRDLDVSRVALEDLR